ncbi:MAG: Clostripain family protein, partial [Oscillospiraceae bacterium]|nr:Clostripain family protein [Oscillospiraceae bacterium]
PAQSTAEGNVTSDIPAERGFSNSATELSVSSGKLAINRRERAETKPMGEDGWTILVYMCGTDLESNYGAATNDIIEAVSAEYSNKVRIVYQTGGTNLWSLDISNSSIQRFENVDGNIALVDEQPDASMGDPATLQSFIEWGIENYPAEKMGLVFWNHGSGSINGVCFDELHDKDSLSLREIDGVLNSVYDKMTDKFEFIGFDACLMSTLEAANILVPYARYMFASEETEPGSGWNYTDIMNFLSENPDADGAALGEMQCPSYYQHCIDINDYEGSTFAITDLSKIDELLVSFNATAKELYESELKNDIARAVYGADNFGGNNRSEGYTNMVDLKGFLNAVQPYASNASDTLSKLESSVIAGVNGPQHEGAGGLSMYYPLAVQGSQELSVFADVATSAYYLGFVDLMAYGTTGGDVTGYDNTDIIGDCDDLWEYDYSADENVGVYYGFNSADENSAITVQNVFFDENGSYTVQLGDTDAFNYAAGSLFRELDGVSVYLGEDDDIRTDYDEMTLRDNFDGTWTSLGGIPLAIEAVGVTDDTTVYTCPILLNGEQTNLRLEFDWNVSEYTVIGTWQGIDPETGAAARETVSLTDGDRIEPLWLAIYDDGAEYISGGEYIVNGEPTVEYAPLDDGDFSYSMVLYDVYGNCYYTPSVGFAVEGDVVYFDPDGL